MLKLETMKNPLVSIVDDDSSVRTSTGRLVRSLGFRAEVFSSALEFLTCGHPATTACLILDLRMPDIDGLKLQRHLKDADYQIPVVFVTGSSSAREESQATAAGAVGFLRKPISADVLANVIQMALRLYFPGPANISDPLPGRNTQPGGSTENTL